MTTTTACAPSAPVAGPAARAGRLEELVRENGRLRRVLAKLDEDLATCRQFAEEYGGRYRQYHEVLLARRRALVDSHKANRLEAALLLALSEACRPGEPTRPAGGGSSSSK